jgi:hypothetical protein
VGGSYRFREEKLSVEMTFMNWRGVEIHSQSMHDISFKLFQNFILEELQSLFFDVEIESNPPSVDVFIEDVYTGKTPMKGYSLPPGMYQFVLRHPGYRDQKLQLKIPENREINVTLEKLDNPDEDLDESQSAKEDG